MSDPFSRSPKEAAPGTTRLEKVGHLDADDLNDFKVENGWARRNTDGSPATGVIQVKGGEACFTWNDGDRYVSKLPFKDVVHPKRGGKGGNKAEQTGKKAEQTGKKAEQTGKQAEQTGTEEVKDAAATSSSGKGSPATSKGSPKASNGSPASSKGSAKGKSRGRGRGGSVKAKPAAAQALQPADNVATEEPGAEKGDDEQVDLKKMCSKAREQCEQHGAYKVASIMGNMSTGVP